MAADTFSHENVRASNVTGIAVYNMAGASRLV